MIYQDSRNTFLKSVLHVLLSSCGDVLKRQLSDSVEDEKFSSIPEHPSQCLLTNLVGQNAFGDYNFQKSKHRCASLFHHSSLHMAKHNKVDSWLNTKSAEEYAVLMRYARKFAKILPQKHHLREREVMFAVREKMLENAAAQQDTLRKAAETNKNSSKL